MNAVEYLETLEALGWKQADLCRRVAVNKSTASRWGQDGPPAWVGEYLGVMLGLDALHRQFIRPVKPAPISADGENAGPLPKNTRAADRVKRLKKAAQVVLAADSGQTKSSTET